MTVITNNTLGFLFCLVVAGISSNHHYVTAHSSNLRRSNNNNNNQDQSTTITAAATRNRDLQFGGGSDITTDVLNGLIQNFAPALEDIAQSVLAETLDPVNVGDETTVDLGSFEFPLPFGSCETSASATYGLGTITGLSNININSLELIPGSETIETIGLFGLGGARWSGTWLLDASFDDVTAETSAALKTDSCLGDPIEQTLTGTTTLNEPSIQINMTVGGETTNLILFTQSSQITDVTLEGLDFELGTVDAGFSGTGTIIPDFELGNTFDVFLLNEFSDEVEPLILDALNEALVGSLPIQLGR